MGSTEPPTNAGQTFHLQEYDALRQEMLHHINVNENAEKEALIGSVLVYAWVLAQSSMSLTLRVIVSVLPLALVLFGWVRARAHGNRIGELGSYIKALENKYGEALEITLPTEVGRHVEVNGWETYLAQVTPGRWYHLGLDSEIRWRVYVLLSLAAPLAFYVLFRDTASSLLVGA